MPLPNETTHAIDQSLRALEDVADTNGWGAHPVAFGLFDQPGPLGTRMLDVAQMPLDDDIWHIADRIGETGIPQWLMLQVIADAITDRLPTPLRHWLHSGDHTFIGLAFIAEVNIDPHTPGRRMRAATACDIDRRIYQVLRHEGTPGTRVTITDSPADPLHATAVPDCLHRLVSTLTTHART